MVFTCAGAFNRNDIDVHISLCPVCRLLPINMKFHIFLCLCKVLLLIKQQHNGCMPVRAVCKPHSPDLKRGALATDARGCSLWRSLLERPPPAPESRVRDPLGEWVWTRVGGVTRAQLKCLCISSAREWWMGRYEIWYGRQVNGFNAFTWHNIYLVRFIDRFFPPLSNRLLFHSVWAFLFWLRCLYGAFSVGLSF